MADSPSGRRLPIVWMNDREIAVGPRETVLQAALRHGIDFPLTYRVGGCGTCKCRVVDGRVNELTETGYLLTDEEIDRGFVVACQSDPRTDVRIEVELPKSAERRAVAGRIAKRTMLSRDVARLEVELDAPLPFAPGQYASLSIERLDGVARSYSFATPPRDDGRVTFFVRRVTGGRLSSLVCDEDVTGRVVRVEGPSGDFRLRKGTAHLLLVAGSTGIAPILAMLEAAVKDGIEREATLLFGVREERDLFALDAIAEIGRAWRGDFRFVLVPTAEPAGSAWKGERGDLAAAVARHLEPDAHVYLFGSPELIDSALAELARKGHACKQVHHDRFTTVADTARSAAYYGAYSNAARGRRRRALEVVGEAGTGDEPRPTDPGTPHPDTKTLRRRWAELIKRVYEVDPLLCPACGGEMRSTAERARIPTQVEFRSERMARMTTERDVDRLDRILIRSKLERPPLPGRLVARPRLVERLEKGLDGRVTLIAAPAGYGKTTLALQWLAQRTGDTAWVSLSHRESEPERFASYLVTAIRNQRPGALAQTAALLDARTEPPWSYFCDVLLSELSELAVLEEPLLLALDDFHLIASREVHELIVRMVEELPETLRLLTLGRIDPPWPLGRWRGKGWLAELRGRDLRFTPDEIRAYFTGQDGPSLDDAEIDVLGVRTEGWAAGLQLARISIAQAPNPHERAHQFSGDDQLVVDYLMSEVLALQPPEVLQLLAVTAPLERFCAPLCAHLLAERSPEYDAGELLARLERHQLFLLPLDAERRWFRYHHLFRQLLLQRLPELESPEQRARITARAAEWFAGEVLLEEAIQLWVEAGEVDLAADLLGCHLRQVIDEDLSRRLLKRWLELFPPGAIRDRLPLLVADLYLRVARWDIEGIAELLERAEEVRKVGIPQDRQAGTDLLSADLDAVSAFACYWTADPAAALRHGERALETIGDDGGGMAQSLAGAYHIGALARLGRHDEAFRIVDAAIRRELSRGSGRLDVLLIVRATLQLYENDLDDVAATVRRWLAAEASTPPYWAVHAPYLLGVVALEQDRPEVAEKYFQEVGEFRYLTNSRLFTDSLIGLALVAERRSDREAMASRVADARRFALDLNDPASLEVVESLESRLARFEGSPPTAPTAATSGFEAISYWLEVPSITRAENMLLHPDPEAHRNALAFIDELLARAKMIHNHRQELRLMVLRSDALEAVGRTDEAREALDFALQRAMPHRIVRPFLGGGSRRSALLESLAARSIRSGFLEQLLRVVTTGPMYGDEPAPATAVGAGTKIGPPLTRRELETLELLAKRLTNKEIAARLSVTSAAVKKRLESVYAKLDVHTRREAVAAAVARGFIRTPSL